MMKTEAERLAAAVNAMRPDWPVASVMTFLSKPEISRRPYRDVAVALAWVATDPLTQTPARLLEAGPWWRATQAQGETFTAASMRCTDHPTEPAGRCQPCERAASEDVDHAALAAAARKTLTAAKADYQAAVRKRRDEYNALKEARG